MPDRSQTKIRRDVGFKLVRCHIDAEITTSATTDEDVVAAATHTLREALTPLPLDEDRIIDVTCRTTGTDTEPSPSHSHPVRAIVDIPLAANADTSDDELVTRARQKVENAGYTFVDGEVHGWDIKFRPNPDESDD